MALHSVTAVSTITGAKDQNPIPITSNTRHRSSQTHQYKSRAAPCRDLGSIRHQQIRTSIPETRRPGQWRTAHWFLGTGREARVSGGPRWRRHRCAASPNFPSWKKSRYAVRLDRPDSESYSYFNDGVGWDLVVNGAGTVMALVLESDVSGREREWSRHRPTRQERLCENVRRKTATRIILNGWGIFRIVENDALL